MDLTDLPPAMRHGELWQVTYDVYYVSGTYAMGWVTFQRGMVVVVENGELSLINAIRLSPEGEASLLKLGAVSHVICIGDHGMDVAYYVHRFGATVHSIPGKVLQNDLTGLDLCKKLPFKRGTFINFDRMPPKWKEGVIVLHRDDGDVLVTCDSVQNWENNWGNTYINWIGKIGCMMYPLSGKCMIFRSFMNVIAKEMPMSEIKKDYSKLLDLEFRYLLSGHGYCIDGSAKEAMHKSFGDTFGDVEEEA